jgi:general secretion pathway protein A
MMYNSYFGFSVSPFTATPDPRFFYTNPVYQEAYANLQYGIEAKKGFIVVTGEVGTGKTTLLRKLMMQNLEGTIRTVFVFNTYLNFTELLEVILYDLGLATKESNKVKLLQELNEYLIKQLEQAHIVSVLVDEAQNLSDEALEGLRLLSNLETNQEKLIQIVLMGQPELQARLDRPSLRQLKQRVALQSRLVPLKDEEVAPYIDFRLRAAGYNGADLFYPDSLRQITSYSRGIPRLVNIICDNALLCAYARAQKMVSADMINEVARDLNLGSEVQVTQAETTPSVLDSKREPETHIRETAKEIPQHNVRRSVRIGVDTYLVILILIALASLIDPQNFLTAA